MILLMSASVEFTICLAITIQYLFSDSKKFSLVIHPIFMVVSKQQPTWKSRGDVQSIHAYLVYVIKSLSSEQGRIVSLK
jgi:hypothetical protein